MHLFSHWESIQVSNMLQGDGEGPHIDSGRLCDSQAQFILPHALAGFEFSQ